MSSVQNVLVSLQAISGDLGMRFVEYFSNYIPIEVSNELRRNF